MKQHQSADNSQGQLYIVPTPIGNLADITQRALEVLQAVDLIAAEDTRHTGLLLQHFGINARLFALHDHNEQQKAETLLAKMCIRDSTDPIDIVFCCLGTTRREAGSKEAFIHADYTLVVDTALTGRRLGAQHMLVVSAMGANAHSPFFYNRVKGEMEEALIAQNWPKLTIARPSMLLRCV